MNREGEMPPVDSDEPGPFCWHLVHFGPDGVPVFMAVLSADDPNDAALMAVRQAGLAAMSGCHTIPHEVCLN